jgi:hypothetical protein
MKTKLLLSFTLALIAAGLLGMGSQAALYTAAEDLVDKMIAWSKECGGKTNADCSRNLAALRKTAFKAAESPIEIAGPQDPNDKNPDGSGMNGFGKDGWRARWLLYARLFKYHGECFNRYDGAECREKWAAFEKEEQRINSRYGPDGRWPDFPDALKHRVFMPIPTKHVGDELAKQWVKVPGTDMEIAVEPAEKRDDAVYVPNANLPPDCVEVSPEVTLNAGQDYWTQPPQFKPGNVPDSCVLVKVYQRGAVLGWIYMKKRMLRGFTQQKLRPRVKPRWSLSSLNSLSKTEWRLRERSPYGLALSCLIRNRSRLSL